MKKTLTLLIAGIFSSAAITFAADADFENIFLQDQNFNLCDVLSIRDYKSHFESTDQSIQTTLSYQHDIGNITGNISMIIDGRQINAVLVNSHCKYGAVELMWIQPKFTGALVGFIDLVNRKLTHVTGVINGQRVDTELLFVGYGK